MKTVALYRPFTIEKALDDFDRYMDSFFGESPFTPALGQAVRKAGYLPAVNIRETNDAYLVEAELPGYDEKDIQVQVDGSMLTIESKKETETSQDVSPKKETSKDPSKDASEKNDGRDDGRFLIRERQSASFSRSFKLPEDAETESVTAHFKNGLLNLSVKKRAGAQKRVIQIGTGQN
jgi:HSP20 family protein